eukprot:CAMPEP_0176495338 /NCGR_PEP_ID=MMETSP0200_2-20121128/10593_1 /TAXON_ID=947934 /ORGANISM="Chaetoceros sp., Strain GSL56" /LENGTH=325 /DNA_ID=CAMNT_0017893189 /DNA_START=338 /DNA_END=1315 /DNA_ORIENTATION=-
MVKNLHLHKCSEIYDFLKAACSKCIFKYVLFSRGVVPFPVDELLRYSKEHENENAANDIIHGVSAAKKQTRSEIVNRRKYEKLTQQINSILSDIDAVFRLKKDGGDEKSTFRDNDETSKSSPSGVKAVLITIGPSFSSPNEQYLIRFHEWKDYNSNGDVILENLVKDRLGQEIGRRSVKELVRGTLEDEYCNMFQTIKRGSSVNNNAKVNVACLVRQSSIDQHLFRGRENSAPALDSRANNDIHVPFSSNTMPFMMNRNLEVKEPRMYSKSKGLHRPFVVLDVIPNLKPVAVYEDGAENAEMATFVQEETDVWIQFRHSAKGIRL